MASSVFPQDLSCPLISSLPFTACLQGHGFLCPWVIPGALLLRGCHTSSPGQAQCTSDPDLCPFWHCATLFHSGDDFVHFIRVCPGPWLFPASCAVPPGSSLAGAGSRAGTALHAEEGRGLSPCLHSSSVEGLGRVWFSSLY